MIFCTSGGGRYLLKVFSLRGSIFPPSLLLALPCAALAAGLRHLMNIGYLQFLLSEENTLRHTEVWTGYNFLVGFLVIFRTSQAYNRFWEGCGSTYAMRAHWYDACSSLIAFCRHSSVDSEPIMRFKHTLVRLFSMLHVAALAELEDMNGQNPNDIRAFHFELVDADGIDEESLDAVRNTDCRVELIFEWIQLLVVDNLTTGVLSIPAPILSRAFHEIANGMVALQDAKKLCYVPFPFPYSQTCDCLLLLHWLVLPFVFSQWVNSALWSFTFVFIQVFVLWSLNFIAVEIENPFGSDANDLDGHQMQLELNRNLTMLLQPLAARVPTLSEKATWSKDPLEEVVFRHGQWAASFHDVWAKATGSAGERPLMRSRTSQWAYGSVTVGSAQASPASSWQTSSGPPPWHDSPQCAAVRVSPPSAWLSTRRCSKDYNRFQQPPAAASTGLTDAGTPDPNQVAPSLQAAGAVATEAVAALVPPPLQAASKGQWEALTVKGRWEVVPGAAVGPSIAAAAALAAREGRELPGTRPGGDTATCHGAAAAARPTCAAPSRLPVPAVSTAQEDRGGPAAAGPPPAPTAANEAPAAQSVPRGPTPVSPRSPWPDEV